MPKTKLSPQYFCQLGSFSDISWAELQSVSEEPPTRFNQQVASISQSIQPEQFLQTTGGLIKIWQALEPINPNISEQDLHLLLAKKLIELGLNQGRKLEFFVAQVGQTQNSRVDLLQVKQELEKQGQPARFRTGPRTGLSAALLTHRTILELAILCPDELTDSWWLAQTVAVQNIDRWQVKDRGRPFAEHRRGLTPPKLARILVNLAKPELKPGQVIYDPFCGGGTILMEAIDLGFAGLGSDLDDSAVMGTIKNLDWFCTKFYYQSAEYEIFQSEVTKAKLPYPTQAIVTEPFLGKPKPKPGEIKNIIKGLLKMYIGALKHWSTLLPAGAPLVIIMPRFGSKPHLSLYHHLIDKLPQLGYTSRLEPLLYARKDAVVQREIVKLIKQ